METLDRQVRLARRRLTLQRYFKVLSWSLFTCLLVAVIGLAIPKIWAIPVDANIWDASWIGGSLATGLLFSILWTLSTRHGSLDAAMEIDRRFGLKERVSTSLALGEAELQTDAGQALLSDTKRRVERIDVQEKFAISIDRKAMLPLVPIVIAFLVIVLFDNAHIEVQKKAAANSLVITKQVKESTKQLQKKMAQRRAEAKEKNLEKTEAALKKIEDGLHELNRNDKIDQKKALVKLNDLAKDIKKRRDELGSKDELRKQLGKLKNIQQGPADKVAKALKNGDFNKAIAELKKLQKKFQQGNLTKEEQKKLAEQLKQLQKKLNEAANAHRQAKEELKKQIQKKLNQGDRKAAADLQKQLDKLNQQNPANQQLAKLAQKLGECAKCMNDGDKNGAMAQLNEMAQAMAKMQQENDELEMLDDAMMQLADAKNAMGCKQCNGQGCAECQGMGEGMGQGKGKGKGRGLGDGQGKGDRPEEKTKTSGYDSQVRGKVGPGKIVATGEIDGPNRAGDASEQIKDSIEAARREKAKPLTDVHLPRSHRDHLKQYLDSLSGRDE